MIWSWVGLSRPSRAGGVVVEQRPRGAVGGVGAGIGGLGQVAGVGFRAGPERGLVDLGQAGGFRRDRGVGPSQHRTQHPQGAAVRAAEHQVHALHPQLPESPGVELLHQLPGAGVCPGERREVQLLRHRHSLLVFRPTPG